MTTYRQEHWAVMNAREFLYNLSNPSYALTPVSAIRRRALEILKHYPLEGLTNVYREGILSEVLDANRDSADTHYEGCYRKHAGCLARLMMDLEEGEY